MSCVLPHYEHRWYREFPGIIFILYLFIPALIIVIFGGIGLLFFNEWVAAVMIATALVSYKIVLRIIDTWNVKKFISSNKLLV
jgi:hypothetical protein